MSDEAPLLRIVKGDPTPEELAALAAVVAARRVAASAPTPPPRPPVWGHPSYAVRREHRAGSGAWRASALPR